MAKLAPKLERRSGPATSQEHRNLTIKRALNGAKLMAQIKLTAQLARPTAFGKLPRGMRRHTIQCEHSNFLDTFLAILLTTNHIAEKAKGGNECLNRWLSRGIRRPVEERRRRRPPKAAIVAGGPCNAVVTWRCDARERIARGRQSRKRLIGTVK